MTISDTDKKLAKLCYTGASILSAPVLFVLLVRATTEMSRTMLPDNFAIPASDFDMTVTVMSGFAVGIFTAVSNGILWEIK